MQKALQQIARLLQQSAKARVADGKNRIAHQGDGIHPAHSLAFVANLHIDGVPNGFDPIGDD
jgi:hypothetical protein